jgi:hypothetical protein
MIAVFRQSFHQSLLFIIQTRHPSDSVQGHRHDQASPLRATALIRVVGNELPPTATTQVLLFSVRAKSSANFIDIISAGE